MGEASEAGELRRPASFGGRRRDAKALWCLFPVRSGLLTALHFTQSHSRTAIFPRGSVRCASGRSHGVA